MVGDGPARRSLEGYARERGISDRLTIPGVVSRKDVAQYISAFVVCARGDHCAAELQVLEIYTWLLTGRIAPR